MSFLDDNDNCNGLWRRSVLHRYAAKMPNIKKKLSAASMNRLCYRKSSLQTANDCLEVICLQYTSWSHDYSRRAAARATVLSSGRTSTADGF